MCHARRLSGGWPYPHAYVEVAIVILFMAAFLAQDMMWYLDHKGSISMCQVTRNVYMYV